MLLLLLGAFTGAYPLMYFAREFVPIEAAIIGSAAIVLAIIAIRAATVMGIRLAAFGAVLPAPGHPRRHPRLRHPSPAPRRPHHVNALTTLVAAMALMPRKTLTPAATR